MNQSAADFRVVAAGDAAIVLEFEPRIDPLINARAIAVAEAIELLRPPGVRESVVGYRSVTIYVDPLEIDIDAVTATVTSLAAQPFDCNADERSEIRVPICYGGDFGLDLPAVAAFAGCAEADVIARHAARQYRVFMVGFLPGFPYMASVDETIAAPRRATPRTCVPAGSIGIAAQQTGIYPVESPGGWNVIGRTPIAPFDLNRSEPCLFRAGDRVRFVSIDLREYHRLAGR